MNRLSRWTIVIVVAVLAAAEFGYWFYDANVSPEVGLGGVMLPGVPVSGNAADIAVDFKDPARYLLIRADCENASDAAAEEARAGIPGTLRAIRAKDGRTWEVPFLLSAKADGVHRHASVEISRAGSSASGALGLAVCYSIDFDFTPTGLGEAAFQDLYRTDFPAGSRLDLHFDLLSAPGEGARVYIAYSRKPRLLHQILF